MTMKDECWTCGSEIDLDDDSYIEIRLINKFLPDDARSAVHRSCMECAKSLPGVNDDNIDALFKHPTRS